MIFTLDVEGAEYSVLQSINFDLVGFGIILVEADDDENNPMKNMAARNLLESNGYLFLRDKDRSSWFVNKDFGTIYKEMIHA